MRVGLAGTDSKLQERLKLAGGAWSSNIFNHKPRSFVVSPTDHSYMFVNHRNLILPQVIFEGVRVGLAGTDSKLKE